MIKNIAVLGAGVMGHGIAQIYAQAGYSVRLYDLKKEYLNKAEELITNNLTLLVEKNLITENIKASALSNIAYTDNLKEAVSGVDFITEVVPEVLEIKHDLYKQLEAIIERNVIIASNTSALPLSALVDGVKYPDRFLITHFFNPAQLVPLVEVVKSEHTKEEVVQETKELLTKANKAVVVLKKEVPGFIANRLQAALAREAFYLIEEGIAEADEIDTAVSNGIGFRWAFIGPIETADFGGLDTWYHVCNYLAPRLSNADAAPEILKSKFEAGKLGVKAGEGFKTYTKEEATEKIKERDNYFIELLKLKQQNI